MNRKQFDKIASNIGVLLAVVFIAAGALLQWGGSFANGQVKNQLAEQKIVFPAADSASIKALPAADAAAMKKYAGMTMTTGAQANTWANHYIAVHMNGIGQGKTYEEVSGAFMAANAAAQANPKDATLAAKAAQLGGLRQTLFMGDTLRGLLGFSYAFSVLGSIAIIASYVCFAGGLIFLVLALLGFAHLRRAATDSEN